jgi:hypothetical protein
LSGEQPQQTQLILQTLNPFEYVRNIVNEMFEMYVKDFDKLLFSVETSHLLQMNPKTKEYERHYSHPVTSRFCEEITNWAKLYYREEKVRVLMAHLYSDSSGADDDEHHPVYLQIANSTLEHYCSPDGRRVVALLPLIPKTSKLPSDTLAHFRTRLFHFALGKLTKPFHDAHLKVSLSQ